MTLTESRISRAETLTLIAIVVLLTITMPRFLYVGDAVAMRVGTVSLLNHGELSVPEELVVQFGVRGQYFYQNEQTGRWYSKYGLLDSLLYVPPLAVEKLLLGKLKPLPLLTAKQRLLRVALLSTYNIGLSLLIAIALLQLGRFYHPSRVVVSLYVLSCFFGSFLWNYLRGHTVEIFQVLFFTWGFLFFIRAHREMEQEEPSPRVWKRNLLGTGICIALLILEKPLFLLFPILLGLGVVIDLTIRRQQKIKLFLSLWLWIPTLLGTSLWLLLNQLQFGSVLHTGYDQWEYQGQILSTQFGTALAGFTWLPRKSVILHFPLFGLALLSIPVFARRHRFDFGLLFFIFGSFLGGLCFVTMWAGDWCYGPRYLLFVLPVLCLPVLVWLEQSSGWKFVAILSVSALLSGWSLANQVFCNRFEFFVTFRVQAELDMVQKTEATTEYFRQPIWTIHRDLQAFAKKARPFPPLEQLDKLPPSQKQRREKTLRGMLGPNYLFLR